MVKQSMKELLKEKAMQNVEEAILDALIPPAPSATPGVELGKSTTAALEAEQNEKTRNWFREKIANKEIEDKKIEINVAQPAGANIGVMGPIGMDDASMQNIQEMMSGMLPKRTKKRKVTIEEARKILLDEEVAKLIDMDEVKELAVKKAENLGIIFIDEIDKIARSNKGGGGGPDVSRDGVQRDLLPIVEGSAVNTKYGVVNTDHILFIAAGAFHFSKPSDLIPELQGRFPIRTELEKLKTNDFYRILKEPKNSLTKQYEAMFLSEGVELKFEDSAIQRLAEIAYEVNNGVENIGARRLQTVMAKLLNDFLFDIPETILSGSVVTITPDLVNKRLSDLVKDKDLSQYIL
ncbi:MAG: ATP-dependent protease ATPase subunit HslU, partial [Cytophagales bacterium]|nr:ATP-dependent protease ATPase subunit HslU [Cytophagales bacterium]